MVISRYIIMAFGRVYSLTALTTVTDCFSLVLRGAGVLHVWGGCHAQRTPLSPLTENHFLFHVITGNIGNAF